MTPARTLPLLAVLLLIASPGDAADGGMTIGALPPAKCPENSGVYIANSDGVATSGMCRFAFMPHWERNEPESEALISIDGKLVKLHRIDHNKNDSGLIRHYVLTNEDGTTRVRLDARGNCPSGVEGCDFGGLLSVNAANGKTAIKVTYYRGG